MTEEGHRWWDTLTKVLAPFLTIVGLIIGVVQFAHEQHDLRERELQILAKNDALEFKRRIWERQLNTYMNTAQAAGQISVLADQPQKLKAAADRFETLYWGNIILVEDPGVRESLKRFHLEILDYRKGQSSPDQLKIRAALLAEALRASSHASWTQLSGAALSAPK
jgi:hypothetical protein